MTPTIFETSADMFARSTDATIAAGIYQRGRLFVDAMRKGLPAGGLVLDYGSGPGRIAAMLAQEGFLVEGRDPSAGMIAAALSLPHDPQRLSFTCVDDCGDGLQDAAYAGIVCSSVIEFVPEPARLLKNLRRAAKPDAVLALSYSNRSSLWRAFAQWRYGAGQPHYALQCNVWTFEETKKMLADADFAVTAPPIFLECAPFDKRPALRGLSRLSRVGSLGFVTAAPRPRTAA